LPTLSRTPDGLASKGGKDKEAIMTTSIDRSKTVADSGQETLERRNRGLEIAVVILTILVLGLGAWIIYDYTQGSAFAPSAEIEQLVDDYHDAWNNYDGEAFLATTREGYTFTSSAAGTFDRAEQLDVIEKTLPSYDWEVERLDDPMVIGDGPWWYVSFPVQTSDNLRDSINGMTVLTVVDFDGTYLVAGHVFIGR
jgi:hypothetical protein